MLTRGQQGSTGGGLNENIVEAYNFIVNNYAPGDKLYFFGFSRGAYTVRAVAGLVCSIGVLKPSFMSAFLKAYSAYLHPTKLYPKEHKPFGECTPWKEFENSNTGVKYANCLPGKVDIDVIGVWDTVGSLGVPDLGHLWKYHKADPSVYECYDTDLHPRMVYLAREFQWRLLTSLICRNSPCLPSTCTRRETRTLFTFCLEVQR